MSSNGANNTLGDSLAYSQTAGNTLGDSLAYSQTAGTMLKQSIKQVPMEVIQSEEDEGTSQTSGKQKVEGKTLILKFTEIPGDEDDMDRFEDIGIFYHYQSL